MNEAPGTDPAADPDPSQGTEPSRTDLPARPADPAEHPAKATVAAMLGLDGPAKLGRFVVLRLLGSGAMGDVYTAYDEELDRKIAIKVVRFGAQDEDGRQRARMQREAQAMAKLNHPNVVTVHEVGTHHDQVFIAMEYVEGQDLRSWLAGDHTWQEVVALFVQAGRGLAAAHGKDLVHRDFKPENVLVGNDGRARVADFGLVLPLTAMDTGNVLELLETARPASDTDPSAFRSDLTRSGALLGTPAYMAPEQLLRVGADARADQYSFCVALYEALFLRRPHDEGSFRELIKGRLAGDLPPRVKGRGPPGSIHRILERGLSREPGDRYPTMDALLVDLERAARPPRRALWAMAAMTLGAAVAVPVLMVGNDEDRCAGSTEEIQAVWNQRRKAEIQAAFDATAAPFAADTYERTVSRLDAFATEWEAHHRAACETLLDGGEASTEVGKQMLCLGQRLRQLEALADRLTQADADAVQKAAEAAGALEGVSTCTDETVLAQWDPSMSAELRAQLENIDRALAVARTNLALGKYQEGLAALAGQEEAARRAGHLSSVARVLELRGALLAQVGDDEQAETTLREAVRVADEARDDATRAWAWVRLVRAVGYNQGRHDEGLALAEDARAATSRLGESPALMSELYNNMGSIAMRKGDYVQALEHHTRALELRRNALGENHPDVGASLNNLGNVQTAMGDAAAALETHRKALATFERALGSSHPFVGYSLHNIANALYALGDNDAAIEAAEKALELRKQVHGERHKLVGKTLNSLGLAQLAAGRTKQALVSFERAVVIKRETMAPDHPNMANSLTGVGRARVELGRADEAVEPLEQAVKIHEKAGSAAEDLGESLFALARALDGSDRTRALEMARRARDAYAEAGHHAAELAAVNAWLAERS